MGGPEVWFETADMLKDEEFKKMLADYGEFYLMSQADRQKISGGRIVRRSFSFPYFASALGAYGARKKQNKALAEKVWKILFAALITEEVMDGFEQVKYEIMPGRNELWEIPWIKTNFVSQWCLNVIVALDFIRQYLPKTMQEVQNLLKDADYSDYHHS